MESWSRPLFAAMLIAATARVASADTPPDANERDAQAAAFRGDYLTAAAKYRDAYREAPRPDLICNVGVAYYKAKDLPRAQRYLDQCASSGASLDPTFMQNVRTVLAAVEQTLASSDYKPLNFLVLPATATTSFSAVHDEPIVGSHRVWVPFGTYSATVHADGYVDQSLEIAATSRDPADYSVKLAPAPVKPVEVPKPLVVAPVAPAPQAPPRRSFKAPLVLTAVTGVAGGIAIGYYAAARGNANDANNATDAGVYNDAKADARSHQHIAWIAGGVAGAAAITAGYLWWRALERPTVEVSANASSSGAAIGLSGRF